MTPRVDVNKVLRTDAGQAMLGLGKAVDASGVERTILELVKLRVSQINGCAYCCAIPYSESDLRRCVTGVPTSETDERALSISHKRTLP
jgi:hypothetical protein